MRPGVTKASKAQTKLDAMVTAMKHLQCKMTETEAKIEEQQRELA